MCNRQKNEMHEIKLWQAEKCELTKNMQDSRKMRDTWQGCISATVSMVAKK